MANDDRIASRFPESEALLTKARENLAVLSSLKEELERTYAKALALQEVTRDLEEKEKQAEAIVRETRLLTEAGLFDEAEKKNAELQNVLNEDFGMPLTLQSDLREIRLWMEFEILRLRLESHVKEGASPLDEEAVELALEKANSLPLIVHSLENKGNAIQSVLGLKAEIHYQTHRQSSNDLSLFESLTEVLKQATAYRASFDASTQDRVERLDASRVAIFNAMAENALNVSKDLEASLALFHKRDLLDASLIADPLIAHAESDADFALGFKERIALTQKDKDFALLGPAFGKDVSEKAEGAFDLFARLSINPALSPEKFATLLGLFREFDFGLETHILATVFHGGIPGDRLAAYLSAYYDCHKKEGDLEDLSNDLLYLRNNLPAQEQPRIQKLIADFTRSPRAHRVLRKSLSPKVHALAGRGEEKIPVPWGKKMKSARVRSWEPIHLATLIILFGVLVPVLIGILGMFFYGWGPLQPLFKYLMSGLYLILLVYLYIWVYLYAGNDEKPSAVLRRCIGAASLLEAAVALAYFIAPKALSVLSPYASPLLISSGIGIFFGLFLLRDRKRLGFFLTYVPAFLLFVSALILWIVDTINGWL